MYYKIIYGLWEAQRLIYLYPDKSCLKSFEEISLKKN